MGVPPDQSKVKKFITISGGPHLLRYNSRLPILIYAPEEGLAAAKEVRSFVVGRME